MCCREERNMSLDDDLIPTSLEIGTKLLDLATLVHTRLSWSRMSLPRYLRTEGPTTQHGPAQSFKLSSTCSGARHRRRHHLR